MVVRGSYTGQLSNGGETLTLTHPHGTEILSVTYAEDVPWPLTPDGLGFSLEWDNARGEFGASSQWGGSPGAANPPPAIPAVVINEILTAATSPQVDAIELHNPTATAADLGGWYLTDDLGYPWKFRIPEGTVLPAGGYLPPQR